MGSLFYETAYNLSHVLPEQSSDGAIYLVPASVKANDILREGYEERLLDGFTEMSRDLHLDFLLIDSHPGINQETLQSDRRF